MMTNQNKIFLNFIDGKWCSALNKEKEISSVNPANKKIIGYIQNSSEEDVNKAVQAAKNAKDSWRKMSGAAKGNILYKNKRKGS